MLFLHEFAELYHKKHKLLVFRLVTLKHTNKRNDKNTKNNLYKTQYYVSNKFKRN